MPHVRAGRSGTRVGAMAPGFLFALAACAEVAHTRVGTVDFAGGGGIIDKLLSRAP